MGGLLKTAVLLCLAVAIVIVGSAGSVRADGPAFEVLAPPPSPPLQPLQVSVEPMPDLSPFLGKPVVATEIVVEDSPLGTPSPRPITRARPGDTLTVEMARAVLNEVLEWGTFGDAWVNLVAEGAGVRIRVHGKVRKLVESVRIDTHGSPVDSDDLLHEANLDEGTELVGADLDVRTDRMRALLTRRGFPGSAVKAETRETDDPSRILVLVDVATGDPRTLGRRVFYSFGATGDELRQYTDRYAVSVGDRADETALDTADMDLETRLHNAGYYDADVFHDVVSASGLVTLRVRIDSGPRYTIRFAGNDSYDADALRAAAVGDATDADFTPPRMEMRLKHFYEVRGFLDADVTTEIRGDETERARAIVFHITERARVRVSSRSYPCLKEAEIKKLTNGGPTTATAIGREIDSFLEEDLPGADLFVGPDPHTVDAVLSPSAGARREPIDLEPDSVYSPESYERAVSHVQDLYRNEGYLSAVAGPVQVIRRRCDPKSPAGQCIPMPLPEEAPLTCAYDPVGLPLAVPPLRADMTCTPDPAHTIECEPRVALRIPVKLGPRTFQYDVVFKGDLTIDEKRLSRSALVSLGDAVSSVNLEEARRRLLDLYKEEGFAYADVSVAVDRSADQTRARIRFDITEGERVIVRSIVIRGNRLTQDSVIRRRIALFVGQPYRTSDVRKTQERIATLNVFSSVNVALANPLVPQKNKTVVVTVSEGAPQYVEIRPGFSSGEGARGAFEYGHKNLFGLAIGAAVRMQVSYLPDFLITDPSILLNFQKLSTAQRLAARATLTGTFPDIGLGPLVRATVDGVVLNDVERYFQILKGAVIPTLYYRPARQVQMSLGVSAEYNDLTLLGGLSASDALAASNNNLDTAKLLRAPSGPSKVFSERFTTTWDRRDNSFNAHKGTFLAGSVEHADAFATGGNPDGHFLRLSQTFSAYYPVTRKIGFAATLRLGQVIQLVANSQTYPDRFFFMGGFDSMRGWAQDTLIPQDALDRLRSGLTTKNPDGTLRPVTTADLATRGGNLLINPRLELRIPVTGPIETVLFLDTGNTWADFLYPFNHAFEWRAAAGTGVRVQTPVGPLALDYGINLTRISSYEDFGALNFSIGLF